MTLLALASLLLLEVAGTGGSAPKSEGGNAPSLASAVLACYNFNEAGGDRSDSGPNGLKLTENGTVGAVSGVVGDAASFDGIEANFLDHAHTDVLSNISDDFAVTAWVNLSNKATNQCIAGKFHSAGEAMSPAEWTLCYFLGLGDRFGFLFYPVFNLSPFSAVLADTFGAPDAATWYFLYGEWDNARGVMCISVNNGPKDCKMYQAPLGRRSVVAPFTVGKIDHSTTPNQLWGFVDVLALYRRKLSRTELATMYNSGNGAACP